MRVLADLLRIAAALALIALAVAALIRSADAAGAKPPLLVDAKSPQVVAPLCVAPWKMVVQPGTKPKPRSLA